MKLPAYSVGVLLSLSLPGLAQQLTLEEVIVTAQKRVENVQDIPVTINVVSGEMLDSFTIRNANDLADAVPGLTIQHTPQNLSNISMRGLGTGAGQESYDQSVKMAICISVINTMILRLVVIPSRLWRITRV